MAPRATPGGRRARAGRGGGGGNALDRAVTLLSGLLSALNDPANRTVQSLVAVLLLAAEAALCVLIIRRVPCERRSCVDGGVWSHFTKGRLLIVCAGLHPPSQTACRHGD